MKQSVFVVRCFKNRNGVFSWRVQGTLNGLRIRRNFKTQEEAAAEKAALEVSAVQLNSNLRSVSTWLSEPQVREAESVFARMPAGGRPVAFFFDLGVASHREPLRQRPLAEAGNSEAIIRKHYLNLKSPAEAAEFFGIVPHAADEPAGNVVPIEDAFRPAV